MQFFQWIVSNWQLVCGWGTGIFVLSKLLRGFTRLISSAIAVVTRFEKAEGTLASLAINHIPHLQMELERVNKALDSQSSVLESMDGVLKKMYEKQYGDYV